jgi:hypothetical protein
LATGSLLDALDRFAFGSPEVIEARWAASGAVGAVVAVCVLLLVASIHWAVFTLVAAHEPVLSFVEMTTSLVAIVAVQARLPFIAARLLRAVL